VKKVILIKDLKTNGLLAISNTVVVFIAVAGLWFMPVIINGPILPKNLLWPARP